MPDFAGLIKFPTGSDMYNSTYGEPQWWRDLAITTRAQINEQVASNKFARPSLQNTDDLNNAKTPGSYPYWTNTANAPGVSGMVIVSELRTAADNVAMVTQLAVTTGSAPMIHHRYFISGWSAWRRLDAGGDTSLGGSGANEHVIRVSELRRRRGPVEVSTPGAVIIAADHGLANFKSKILPQLQSRGLHATLAVNSQNWELAQNAGVTQSEVKGWVDSGLIEVANHGRTHAYPTTASEWETEIRGGREELESQLGVPIDTYQMAGSDWGSTIEDLGVSARGKIALSSHAIITGMIAGTTPRVYPMTGEPTQGTYGYWVDPGGTYIDTAKARIQDAITEQGVVIIRLHPQFMDTAGYITSAEFTTFLDHLVTLRDQGQITVLQQRDAMIASNADGRALTAYMTARGA